MGKGATLDDIIHGWTDDELHRAIQRAWREAARCWQEARAFTGDAEAGRMLDNDAVAAQAHWQRLHTEVLRRNEVRRQAGIDAHGKCSACSEPNDPGRTLCVGHHRMAVGDPNAEFAPNA